MTAVYIHTRYVRRRAGIARTVREALTYMQRRELGPGEDPADRTLFTAEEDAITRAEAQQLLLCQADGEVAYHRLILSPARPLDELTYWTRQLFDDLAARHGLALTWVGVVHRNTDQPHVHVLLAGSAEADGARRPLRLRHPDLQLLHERGAHHARTLASLEQALAQDQCIALLESAEPAPLTRPLAPQLAPPPERPMAERGR
jgi:hypothetical protein